MKILKQFKVTIVTTALSLICVGAFFFANHALAGSTGWGLRHIEGAPSNVNVDNFLKGVTTEQTTTTASVSSVTTGASVYVYTSNGIEAKMSVPGSYSVNTSKNISIMLYASFMDYGKGGVYAQGTFTY